MKKQRGLFQEYKQQNSLPISMTSSGKNTLPAEVCPEHIKANKLRFYYFLFVNKGTSTYVVDLEKVSISEGQLLFASSNQIITPPACDAAEEYYKIAFDDNILALMPEQFPFLINPLNKTVIDFDASAKERVKTVFDILQILLHYTNQPLDTAIILTYMNSLLTELNHTYFQGKGQPTGSKLSKYIQFRLTVETHLTEQNSISSIVEQLAITTSNLYGIVKEFAGISPKEFVTHRLILEAQRKLRYQNFSVKELAYELGYTDPDYFSRLFKKNTGKSVSEFKVEQKDLSGK